MYYLQNAGYATRSRLKMAAYMHIDGLFQISQFNIVILVF